MQLANLTFLNHEGHHKSFDTDAGGYIRSEGADTLVLERVGKALADRDPFYAVIQMTGDNSDGWTQCVMMPSGE